MTLEHRMQAIAASMAAAIAMLPSTGFAQDIAVPRLHPAFAGDRLIGVASPDGVGHKSLHAALYFDYARNPLVLRRVEDGTTDEEIVGRQLMMHVNATYHLWERIAINVDVPFAIFQTGNWVQRPSTAALGDISLGIRSRLVGMPGKLFHLSIGGQLWFPSGTDSFVTDGAFRGLGQVIVGGRAIDRIIWSVAIGPEFRKTQSFLSFQQGTALNAGAGIAVLLGDTRALQLGLESTLSQVLVNPTTANLNAEAMLHGQLRVSPQFVAGLGAGTGLSYGPGTPQFRLVAMFAYVPRLESTPPPDWDGDGVSDETDKCPQFAGMREFGGCPNRPARKVDEPKKAPVEAAPDPADTKPATESSSDSSPNPADTPQAADPPPNAPVP